MSYLHENLPSKVFRDQYDPTFALELSFKDITLATELGREFNVPCPSPTWASNEPWRP